MAFMLIINQSITLKINSNFFLFLEITFIEGLKRVLQTYKILSFKIYTFNDSI